MRLLTVNNAKIQKGEKYGWLTAVLHLAPFNLSGYNVCPCSTAECRATCLNFAGRGRMNNVQRARLAKTKMLFEHRDTFLALLRDDIRIHERTSCKLGMRPCIRLNCLSDLPWTSEEFGCIPQQFNNLQFYDYTKVAERIFCKKNTPNYHLTLSYTGANAPDCLRALKTGAAPVAVVFRNQTVGKVVVDGKKFPVVDGDGSDLRFLDSPKSIVSLRAKGLARRVSSSRFIVESIAKFEQILCKARC